MTKIVLVDDENIVINSLKKYISTQLSGYEIIGTFSNGADALAFLESNPADIIISDILMPQMDGLELAQQVSQLMPGAVMIILSGFSDFQYAQQAIRYNVFTYLLKPLDYRELDSVLRHAAATAVNRKATLRTHLFADDQAVQFFCDLLFGTISSAQELRRRYDSLGLPFSLEQTSGYLLKLSFDCSAERVMSNISGIMQTLSRSMESGNLFFVRHAERDLFFIALKCGAHPLGKAAQISKMVEQDHHFPCEVEIYRKFSCLKEFVCNENTFTPDDHKQNPNAQLVKKAIAYIESHYSEDISRESVATLLYLSPSHFSSLFKQETGRTFKEFLTNVRMQAAMELLSTQMSINEIAQQVGYLNRNRFIVNFKEFTSYTPTEYRKQVLSMKGEYS